MALLELKGVDSGYGEMQILWGIDLDVQPGETVILLGANSAGKTTLLRTIIGLLPCRGGSIRFDGEPIEKMTPNQRIRRGIAFMSELGVLADALDRREHPPRRVLLEQRRGAQAQREPVRTLSRSWRRSGATLPLRSRAASARCSASRRCWFRNRNCC